LTHPSLDTLRDALRVVIDPDLHRDIVSLGFVTDLHVADGDVRATISLTTPACPAKESLRAQATDALRAVEGVRHVDVRMTASTRASVDWAGPMEASLGGVRHLIAIGAGKGGVGKSSTAVLLAAALARMGARVGLLDADLYGPSLGRLGGPAGTPNPDGVHIVSLAHHLTPERANVLRGPRVSALLQQLLVSHPWGDLDYLLIDLPPGTGDVPIGLAQWVPLSGAVLVTTASGLAVDDTRRAASLFATLSVPVLGVIETMSTFRCGHCDTLHSLFGEDQASQLAMAIDAPLLGQWPYDPRMIDAANAGRWPDAVSPEVTRTAAALAARVSTLHHDAAYTLECAWDALPTSAPPTPVAATAQAAPPRLVGVWREDERTLGLRWSDGAEDLWDVVRLRRTCPCARCVDEDTGRRTLRREDVADNVRIEGVATVGRYALLLRFTDGHDTGRYRWDRLKQS
jgi:ATP-binding protein involved in chromosome partitioning